MCRAINIDGGDKEPPQDDPAASPVANPTQTIVPRHGITSLRTINRVFLRPRIFAPDLQTISLSTLIIQGDCDTSTSLELTGRKTAALIPGSQLKVYERAAHGLPVTHAERLNHDLLVFASS